MSRILTGVDAKKKLIDGVNLVADIAKVTMGAEGKTVFIERALDLMPYATKDGVTAVDAVYGRDSFEEMGVKIVKQAAGNVAKKEGDGPQPLDSQVLTPNGWVLMGDLKVGDALCGTNGSIQRVLEIFPKGKKEVCKLVFSDKREVECCEDHTWTVSDLKGRPMNLTVSEMLQKGIRTPNSDNSYRSNFFIPLTEVEFNKKELQLDPYLVGTLIGDGSLSGTGMIELSLGFNKEHILSSLILPEGITFNAKRVERKNYIRVKFTGKDSKGRYLKDILDEIGLFGTKSDTKFIPENYLYSSLNDRKKLLKGLLDTDGYISNRGLFNFSTVSEQLNKDIIELCRGLGKTLYQDTRIRKEGKSYSMTPLFRIAQLKGYKRGLKLDNIIKTGVFKEMQCIKVSNPDSLYITNDYVVTHNTTSVSVLTQALVNGGFKALEDYSHVALNKEVHETHALILKELDKLTKKTDYENKKYIATISANGDEELGKLIADLYEELGDDVAITVKEGVGKKTVATKVQGLVVERGMALPYFADSDKPNSLNFLGGVNILIVRGKIEDVNQIHAPLSNCMASGKALLIMADDVDEGVMKVIVKARQAGNARVSVTINNDYGNGRKDEALEDICLVTGARALDLRVSNSDYKFGEVKEVFSDQNQTVLIPEGVNPKIQERVLELKAIAEESDEFEKDFILKRISNLQAAVAEITVGGATDMEIKERKDRVDDSVLAVKSAIRGGFIAGGGTTLFYISDKLKSKVKSVGGKILLEAIKAPMLQILSNAKIEHPKRISYGKGIDVRKRKMVDLFKAGVVDSARVTKSALENAISVSTVIFTTEVLILNEDPK